MKTEMHDNIIQGKMNSLQEIPAGISFDATKSWQQLEKQLQPKQKKNIAWLYAAAAFAAAILISGLFYYNTDSSTPVKKEIVLKEYSLQRDTPKNIVAKNDEAKDQNKKTLVSIQQQKSIATNKTIAVETKPDSVVTVENIPQNNNSIAINQLVETKPFVETGVPKTAPAKNKFKVVHLNELNTPQPQVITISKNASLEEIMYKSGNTNSGTGIRNNIKIFQLQRNQNNSPVGITDNP